MEKIKIEIDSYFVETLKEHATEVSKTLWQNVKSTSIWPGKIIVPVNRSAMIDMQMLWHVLENFLNNAEIEGEKLEWNQKYGHSFSPWHEPHKNPNWMDTQPGWEEFARRVYNKNEKTHPDHPDYSFHRSNPYNRKKTIE